MRLTELIGQRISKIRYQHQTDVKEGLQEFQSQIKLSNGNFILIPTDSKDETDLIQHYENNKSCRFIDAKRCGLAYRLLFKKKKIVDVHFKYLDGEHFNDSEGIIELENGKYITETGIGPIGLTDVNLSVMNKNEFEKLNSDGIVIRSFKNDIGKM